MYMSTKEPHLPKNKPHRAQPPRPGNHQTLPVVPHPNHEQLENRRLFFKGIALLAIQIEYDSYSNQGEVYVLHDKSAILLFAGKRSDCNRIAKKLSYLLGLSVEIRD